jgi:DNA-binding transcriptional ArsR family regulator
MKDEKPQVKEISSILNDRCLRSSPRLLILLCLAMNEKLGFTELSKLTGLSKGSLGNHLTKLYASNYILVKEYSFFSSKRISVRITDEGMKAVSRYITAISNLGVIPKEHSAQLDLSDKVTD